MPGDQFSHLVWRVLTSHQLIGVDQQHVPQVVPSNLGLYFTEGTARFNIVTIDARGPSALTKKQLVQRLRLEFLQVNLSTLKDV
jgi:hypothetical protein